MTKLLLTLNLNDCLLSSNQIILVQHQESEFHLFLFIYLNLGLMLFGIKMVKTYSLPLQMQNL